MTLQEQLDKAKADLLAADDARLKADGVLFVAEAERRKYRDNLTKACKEENRALENVVQACLELEKRRNETHAVMPDFQRTGKDVSQAVTVVNDLREKQIKAIAEIKRLEKLCS
jgi:hypothetical protein